MPTPVLEASPPLYARRAWSPRLFPRSSIGHEASCLQQSPPAVSVETFFPFSAQIFLFPLDYCSSSRLEVLSMARLSFLVIFFVWIQLETVESTVSPNFFVC